MSNKHRVLDWVSQHDEKSKDYPIRSTMPRTVDRKRMLWRAPYERIDQGYEGACVGFGWTNELMMSPVRKRFLNSNAYALGVYREAKVIDEWPGEAYDGTSVLAGAKIIKQRGFMEEYRWAFTIDDVIDALVTTGPVVIGIPWYYNMYETRPSGLVEIGGSLVGGHAICLTGYHPGTRLYKEAPTKKWEVIRWRNSWGLSYGRKGDGYIQPADLELLLSDFGEACVPINRK